MISSRIAADRAPAQARRAPQPSLIQRERPLDPSGPFSLFPAEHAQAKRWSVGAPGDALEQEADRVADEVLGRRPPSPADRPLAAGAAPSRGAPGPVQRKCGACAAEDAPIQRKCAACTAEEEAEQPLQAKADMAAPSPGPGGSQPRAADAGLSLGEGAPLPAAARSALAPRFGGIVGDVRVHAGDSAGAAARQIGARAFTVGRDIVFGDGQYAPETSDGRWLLAHEVTHVAQQRAGRAPPTRISRVPSESGVRDGRYSYSTNCGWIDWGHTNPGLARTLIAQVREASQRIGRREQALTRAIAAESTPLVSEAACPTGYEPGEVAASAGESPVFSSRDLPSGAVEIRFGGFGVGSMESSKFAPVAETAAMALQAISLLRGTSYVAQIRGFTDCLGAEARNTELRRQRGSAILAHLAIGMGQGAVVGASTTLNADFVDAPLGTYLASNADRAGRRVNRGVLVMLIPRVAPEAFTGPRMESGAPILGMMSGVTLSSELNRSLSEEEVLRVALSLFVIQSYNFEALQAWTDWISKSSFAEEDLPSNLISFYRAARGFSSDEVRTLCDAWDTDRSLQKLDGYRFQVNPTWEPLSLPAGGAFPPEFRTIAPVTPGEELYDVTSVLRETALFSARCSMHGWRTTCP